MAAIVIGALSAIVMAAAITYGFIAGGGRAELDALLAYPWFRVSLIDVYIGFALFGAWIWHRERSPVARAAWFVGLALLGNFVAGVYVLRAAMQSAGRSEIFWQGPARD